MIALPGLGPLAGMSVLAAYEQLATEASGCPFGGTVEETPETEAVCPTRDFSMK